MEMRRRGFLLGAVAGVCAAKGAGEHVAPAGTAAVPPPGSGGFERLRARCVGCGLCVAKCPTKVLKAATMEYGLTGVMMPVMDFRRGYCEKDCVRCGEVCPAGAIVRLAKEEKPKTKIGLARLTADWEDKCLARKEGHPCALCEKHCPYDAVKVAEENDAKSGKQVRRPVVDPEKCVGCGACAHVCPVSTLEVRFTESACSRRS